MSKRHYFYSLPIILLLIVAVAGWFATDYLGNEARQEIIQESQASILTLSIYVSSSFTHIEGAVKSLSGSPWIAPALISKKHQDIVHANSALDRYNSSLNASVSYLMDADGITVASSNRKDQDSFVGKSYHFRPYFQVAAKGQSYHYFALGITSGKRGFYASYPVQNRTGKVLGVVTMKKDLDDMETFFRKYPFCFFISPAGIIFLSSKPEMVLKSLWALDKAARDTLIASREFGNKLSEDLFLKKEITDGAEVTLEGENYFVSRKVIDRDGWSIVLLTPTDRVWIYRLTSIMATIFVCFLIIVFSAILYLTDRSKESIRQSEESRRLLLHTIADGIFGVDATGRLTFVNPAALSMLGFAEEEMLGQSAHALIHHSREDGSIYPAEGCPMYASYTKATESHITDEVLWRKDGSYFHVEYSSTPITRDGKIMGAVVTFRDITERRQTEEALKENEKKYRLLADNVHDVIFVLDMNLNYTYISPSVKILRGYEPEEVLKQPPTETMTPSSRELVMRTLSEVMELEKSKHRDISIFRTLQLEVKRKDGTTVWTEMKFSFIRDDDQRPVGIMGITRDITERRQAQEDLKRREALLNEMGRIAMVGGWEFDAETQKQLWTKEVYRIHEVDESYEPTVSKGIEFYAPESRPVIEGAVQRAIEYGEPFDVELEIITAKGNHRWIKAKGKVDRERGMKKIISGTFQDITERRQAEEKIRQMAYHDSLTGLPNRKLFTDRLHIVLAQAQRNQKKVGIAMLDLDNFKGVNDTLGHDVGDLLLQATAERLSAVLRKGDTIARFGGDEFVVILPDLKAIEDVMQVAQKIVDSFSKPFLISTHQLFVTISIGIAAYPDDGTDESILLKNADIAMYQAKQAGRDQYQLYKKA